MKKALSVLIIILTASTAINTVKAETARTKEAEITSVSCENGSTVIKFTASDGSIWQYKGNFYLEPGTTHVTLCINSDNKVTDWQAN